MRIKKLGVALVAVAVAFCLTGCFKSTSHYTLHEDDTVSAEIIVALHKDFAEGMSPEDASENVGGSETIEGIEDVESAPYEDSDFIGIKYTFENQPLGSVAPSVDGTLEREGDLFIFEGNAPDTTEL